MKEQEARLTTQAQTGYAGYGGNFMPDGVATQEKPQQAQSEQKAQTTTKESQSNGKSSGAEKAKPPQERVIANAKIKDNNERIAKAEAALKALRRRLGKKEQLSDKEKDVLIRAHKVGLGEGSVYNYKQEHITEKARILAEAFKKEERRLLMEEGYAGVAVPRTEFDTFYPADYTGTLLEDIARELNNLGRAGLASENKLEDIASRVAATVGVPDALRNTFLDQILNFETARAAVEEAEEITREAAREAARFAGRGRGGASPETTLETREVSPLFPELSFEATRFTNPTLQTIFGEVNAELTAGTLSTAFIDAKVAQVTPIIQGPGPNDEEEGQRMQTALFKFNEQIQAKRTTKDERQNIYGDIKLDKEQQKKLIELVLKPDGEGNKDIDRLFNKRFGQIDSNPNSDWQAAIGPGGDIEIRDFINALIQTKEDRIAPLGRAVTEVEKVTIQIKINELTQLKELREKLHTVSYAINSNLGIPELRKFLKYFKAEYQDVAFGLKGVPQIMRLYENAMHQVATEHGGYISYEDMVNTVKGEPSKVEQIVRDQVKLAKVMKMPVFKDMEEYEVLRAISVARGMGIAMGNFFEIIAEKGMSKGVPLTSWWANPIIKRMAPFRQMMRFRQGGKNLAMLAFNLDKDKKGKVWTITDQKYYIEHGLTRLLKEAIGTNKNVQKYAQVLNPLDIGSQWTQTGWRWAQDEEHFNGAMSKLLEHNLINPLIGTGLWVEKQKGFLKDTEEVGSGAEGMIGEVNRAFGVHFTIETTKADLAKLLIRENLNLSIKITPLTLFNNLTELRYAVLRNNYAGEIIDTDPVRDPDRNGDPSVMEGSDLQRDMNKLSLLQEKLLQKRLVAYEEWRDHGAVPADMPHLYYDPHEDPAHRNELTDLSAVIQDSIVTSAVPAERAAQQIEAERIKTLAHNIEHEFTAGHLTELMEDLKEKKWKVPYILGHDMPYDRIDFIKNGPDSVDRRGDDWEIVDATVPLIDKYIKSLSVVHKKEDLVAGLIEIHRTLSGHDLSVADEVVKNLAEATILWFRKDIRAMLPGGFGSIWGVRGDASLAEVAGGREKMAWPREEMDEFVNLIHGASILDNVGEGQIEELRKHTGSTKFLTYGGFGGVGQTVLSFMAIAYLLYMLKKQAEEK